VFAPDEKVDTNCAPIICGPNPSATRNGSAPTGGNQLFVFINNISTAGGLLLAALDLPALMVYNINVITRLKNAGGNRKKRG